MSSQPTTADLMRQMVKSQDKVIETYRRENAALRTALDHHESHKAWCDSIRSGESTLEQYEAALSVEESGEAPNPLPKGYLRTPSGTIKRADPDAVVTEPSPSPSTPAPKPKPTYLDSLMG